MPVQGEPQERSPRAPHERDESADSQRGSEPSAQDMGRRGQLDIERGLVDTDKGPAMQETYERLREGDAGPGPQAQSLSAARMASITPL